MREINRSEFIQKIKEMLLDCSFNLPKSFLNQLYQSRKDETNPRAIKILDDILENQEIAKNENIPLCQDTGLVNIFLEIGNEVYFDFSIQEACDEAVKEAYFEGFLRKSVVSHPLNRINTLDNTPAMVKIKQMMGEEVKITVLPKGAGSENMCKIKMLSPSDGEEGVIHFVKETIVQAGGKACPPIIVGVGIGGSFDICAALAKEAITREIDDSSEQIDDLRLEKKLLKEINELNIGPMGLGGNTTCLAVKVNSMPCHIASLPVAVVLQCHSNRIRKGVL